MAKVYNLAYDYSSFDEDEAVSRDIEHNKNAAAHKRFFSLKLVILCTLVCTLLCVMIYEKVQISGLCSEQTQLQSELTELQDGNQSLESELAQKTSMTKVEEYARNELGLIKLEKSQIEYVELNSEAEATVLETKDRSVFVRIKNWFVSMLEYIGL
jgi:cell division protein FtsL